MSNAPIQNSAASLIALGQQVLTQMQGKSPLGGINGGHDHSLVK